jgi:membrane-bound ClpP family serine protease
MNKQGQGMAYSEKWGIGLMLLGLWAFDFQNVIGALLMTIGFTLLIYEERK